MKNQKNNKKILIPAVIALALFWGAFLNFKIAQGAAFTWTQRTMPATAEWKLSAYGNGVFVAIAGNSDIAATSTNGINWTQRTLPASGNWKSMTFGNGIFLLNEAYTNVTLRSSDGINWTEGSIPISDAISYNLTYGNGMFVAAAGMSSGYGTTDIFATSSDGVNWTQRTMPVARNWYHITYGNGTFVAIAYNSDTAVTSSDGITWTQRTLPTTTLWYKVAYGNGTFVTMSVVDPPGYASSNTAATSSDGINWTQRTLPVSTSWNGLNFGNGNFVAVSSSSPTGSNVSITSSDGINWTQGTLPALRSWYAPVYGNGIYATFASDSNIVATSPGESLPSPTISGFEDGELYFDSVTPITTNGTATLNGNSFTSGTAVNDEGTYTVSVTNGVETVSASFTILKNKTVYDPSPTKINEDYSLGIINTEDPATATSEASLNVNYTLVSNDSSLYIPRDTVITPTEGGTMNITDLTATDIYETIHQENPNTKGAVEIGIPSQGLTFSQAVTVTLSVQPSYNGKVLTIYTRSDEEESWTYHSTCSVSSGKCVFTTTHATQYMGYFEVSNSPTPTDVNVAIDATISLTCSDSVTMGTITGTGQSNLTTNEAVCTVGTINSNGYQLSWQASTAYMENADGNQIDPYSPTVSNIPETWSVESSASEWGARIKSTSTDPDLTSGGIWDDLDSYSGNWLNVSTSPFVVANRSTETSQAGSTETILFGAEIGSNKFQPTGTYDVDVTVTATTL